MSFGGGSHFLGHVFINWMSLARTWDPPPPRHIRLVCSVRLDHLLPDGWESSAMEIREGAGGRSEQLLLLGSYVFSILHFKRAWIISVSGL